MGVVQDRAYKPRGAMTILAQKHRFVTAIASLPRPRRRPDAVAIHEWTAAFA